MSYAIHLWLFFLVVLAVIVLPGLDMAYVLGSALSGGRRPGLTAVAGIVAGGIGHVVLSTLGIGLVLRFVPAAFTVLLLAGALYIAWIGIAVLRSSAVFGVAAGTPKTPWTTFCRAAATCLMNPKAYLFMLAIFPQFVRAGDGPLWLQAGILGTIISVTQVLVYGALVLLAAAARDWLALRPCGGLLINRVVGVLLLGAALATGIGAWRA